MQRCHRHARLTFFPSTAHVYVFACVFVQMRFVGGSGRNLIGQLFARMTKCLLGQRNSRPVWTQHETVSTRMFSHKWNSVHQTQTSTRSRRRTWFQMIRFNCKVNTWCNKRSFCSCPHYAGSWNIDPDVVNRHYGFIIIWGGSACLQSSSACGWGVKGLRLKCAIFYSMNESWLGDR